MQQSAAAQTPPKPPASQNKSALAVSPAIIEHVSVPGQKKDFVLRVSNLTNIPLPISGTVQNFITLEDVEDPKRRAMYDASKWFTITEPDFILQPNQTRSVTVSILAPAGAEPGGHYATVYFQPLLPAGALTPATSYLTARVGTLAFLIQPGQLDERLSVRKFSTPKLQNFNPIEFKLEEQNLGNIHLSPTTNVVVRDWYGRTVARATAPHGVVVPGTRKSLTISLDKNLSFGRYTALATTSYGADKKQIETSTAFWMVPWSSVLLVIIGTPLVIFAVRTRGRWRRAWRILRARE